MRSPSRGDIRRSRSLVLVGRARGWVGEAKLPFCQPQPDEDEDEGDEEDSEAGDEDKEEDSVPETPG